ncbi:hypothetical protein B0T41_21955 [Chromobacterium violaceum]|nr:hypothetical protein B0T41_21955 [Chromobacterium violaceum]
MQEPGACLWEKEIFRTGRLIMFSALNKALSSFTHRINTSSQTEPGGRPIGHMTLNGAPVGVKSTQWPNVYQLGDSGKLTFSADLVSHREANGEMTLSHDSAEGLARMYGEWQDDRLTLMRGISSNHFSWEGIVMSGVAASEGMDDFPGATMGGSGSRWLPTSMGSSEGAMATSSGIAIGNHNQTMRAALNPSQPQDNVLLGMVLRFDAGASRNLAVHFLNPGEILVKGPVENQDFSISHLVVSDASNPVGFGAMRYEGTAWDADLMPAALYDPSGEHGETGRQVTQDWMDRSAAKMNELQQRRLLWRESE